MLFKAYKVFTALLALVFLITSAPVPALAADSNVGLTVDPSSGQVGDSVTVSGTGLYLSQMVMFRLYFSDQQVDLSSGDKYAEDELTSYCYFQVNSNIVNNSFSQTIVVPAYLNNSPVASDGTYYFYLAKLTSIANKHIILAGTPFEIAGFSDVLFTPTEGHVGQELEITGEGFSPGESIQILFDGEDITEGYLDGEPKAASSGTFNVVVPVPAASYGEKEVKIVGASSRIEVVKTFTVLPKITLSPTFGGPSTRIIVHGTGFSQNTDISFNNALIVRVQVTSGSFMEEIEIPADTEYGSYVIKAEDTIQPDIISATANYEVIDPLIAPNPLEPSKSQQDVPVNTTFSWDSIEVATSYDFQLSTDPGFESDIIVDINLTETTYTHNGSELIYDTYYYWRVRAVAEDEACSPWCQLQNFHTVPESSNPGEITETPTPAVTVTVTVPPVTTTVGVTSPPLTVTQTQPPVTVTETNEVTYTTTAVITTTAVSPTVTLTQPPITITNTEIVEQPPVTVTQTIEPVNPPSGANQGAPNWAMIGMILGGAVMASAGIVILIDKIRY